MNETTKLIRSKGWTLKALAERWGFTPRHVSNITNEPSQMHLDAIAGLPSSNKERQNDDREF